LAAISPPAERNKQPILEVLTTRLKPDQHVLELACGTLQHALHFTANLPNLRWQPTDLSIETVEAGQNLLASGTAKISANLRAPIPLDVLNFPWAVPAFDNVFDSVYAANLLHISPIEVVSGVFKGASLGQARSIFIYGPFFLQGQNTAQSNLDFDASLRGRNPAWGIRQLKYVEQQAQAQGYTLTETVPMPANNLFLEFTLQ